MSLVLGKGRGGKGLLFPQKLVLNYWLRDNYFFLFQAYKSTDFVPALKLAKDNGLKLALHIAEASILIT